MGIQYFAPAGAKRIPLINVQLWLQTAKAAGATALSLPALNDGASRKIW